MISKIRRIALIKKPTKAILTNKNFTLLNRCHEANDTINKIHESPAITIVRNNVISFILSHHNVINKEVLKNFVSYLNILYIFLFF